MNRGLRIVLCAAVVWAAGLGEATEGGLKRRKGHQTEIGGGTRLEIPQIVGDYVPIYKPQADVYTGKDTKNYKAGQRYTNWQPNDDTFIKRPDNRRHCFGITRPDDVKDDGGIPGAAGPVSGYYFRRHIFAPKCNLCGVCAL